MIMKGCLMEVFGEEYDLSNCTPEELKQVEEWYDKNKEAEVPDATDHNDGTPRSEAGMSVHSKPSGDLDVLLALESIQSNPNFNPDLEGKPEHLELYRRVHPLGGNLTVGEAASGLGINRVTAYRWLNRVMADNPTADLAQWPTKAQLDVYRLIHPDLGGLTYREAAKALKSTYQHVVDMVARMRKTHPQAFSFERVPRPTVVRYDPSVHDDEAVEKF